MKCFYLHMLTECSTELLKGTERNFVNITEMFYTWHQYEHTLAAKLMSNWKIFLFVVWKQNKFTYFLLLPPHNMLHCDNWTETANPCAACTKKPGKNPDNHGYWREKDLAKAKQSNLRFWSISCGQTTKLLYILQAKGLT